MRDMFQTGIIQGGAASCRAGDLRNDSFIWRGGTPHLLGTLPNSGFAEWKSSAWNVCGAWKDSFWLPFGDGWVFPHGSNHLSGVEVVSQGMVWPTPFDKNAIATIGAPVEIVRGFTTFEYEFTTSNSYRFVWTDAAINRDTNNLVTATLELFRDSGVCVTTNGVAAYLPRELPFPLSVGELSVAVTNAGEYVFLLEKCTDYLISVFPETATNFVCSAVDDIAPRPLMFGMAGINDGWWTTDSQGLKLVPPMYPMTLFTPRSHVLWIPTLQVSPSTWQPSSLGDTETFTAIIGDIPRDVPSVAYRWNTSDSDVVSIAAPTLPATQMTAHYPEADDDGNGTVDAMSPFLGDDDIAMGSILLNSPVSTNGTVVFEGVYGYDECFGERPLVYSDSSCTEAVEPGSGYPVVSRTSWSMPLYFNPATVSASHPGVYGVHYRYSVRRLSVMRAAYPRCFNEYQTNYVANAISELVDYPESELPD